MINISFNKGFGMEQLLTGKPNFSSRSADGIASDASDSSRRLETEAIWKRETSKDNNEFLSISLRVNEIETLLNRAKNRNADKLNLVAFLNNKGGVPTRPDFRVFEEIPKN